MAIDEILDWILNVLTTYIHVLELQVITGPPLIYMLYKPTQRPLNHFPTCCVFLCRTMATALRVEILQHHVIQSSLDKLQYRTDLVDPVSFLLGTDRIDNTIHSRLLTVSAGTCSYHTATGCVNVFIKNPLAHERASFHYRYLATCLHATILRSQWSKVWRHIFWCVGRDTREYPEGGA